MKIAFEKPETMRNAPVATKAQFIQLAVIAGP